MRGGDGGENEKGEKGTKLCTLQMVIGVEQLDVAHQRVELAAATVHALQRAQQRPAKITDIVNIGQSCEIF